MELAGLLRGAHGKDCKSVVVAAGLWRWGGASAAKGPSGGEQGENYWGLVLKRRRASRARQGRLQWLLAGVACGRVTHGSCPLIASETSETTLSFSLVKCAERA